MRTACIIFSCLFLSCNSKIPEKSNFKLMLPDTSNYFGKFTVESANILAQDMDLEKLDKGVDSFELRIWNRGIIQPNGVVTIKYLDKKLTATKILIYGNEDKSSDSSMGKRLDFRIDSKLFYDSLLQFDLLQIPNQNDIPNFKDGYTDGESFTIEIAGKDYYKLICYHCPDLFQSEPNNKKVLQLLNFITRNLEGSGFWFCR